MCDYVLKQLSMESFALFSYRARYVRSHSLLQTAAKGLSFCARKLNYVIPCSIADKADLPVLNEIYAFICYVKSYFARFSQQGSSKN